MKMSNRAKQIENGKAFEFALLVAFYNRLKILTKVSKIENESYKIAKKCYDTFGETEQSKYQIVASAAVNFLIDVEPRLSNGINEKDSLQLEIVPDKKGQLGDVRDVLAIRALQKWEIGVSAKNNHRAVKHSRLSPRINFGKKWLGIDCSTEYFDSINPVFNMLNAIKKKDRKSSWDSIENMHETVYVPVLNAFKDELIRLDKENPEIVSKKLVEYLIGNQDFYKVIKDKKGVEIQAYNIHGTLNLPFEKIKPKAKMSRLKLPTRLVEVIYEEGSLTTLLVTLNEGWQISFRIHSAKSTVEASLKFDINLVSAPHSLFTNHIFLSEI